MNRAVLVLIGSVMAGEMAAAEATGNDSTIKATIPVGSTIVIPVSEGSKEVVFDVEGKEIDTTEGLSSVSGDGDFAVFAVHFIRDIFLGGALDGAYEKVTGKGLWDTGREASSIAITTIEKGYKTYCLIVYCTDYKNVRGWLSDK